MELTAIRAQRLIHTCVYVGSTPTHAVITQIVRFLMGRIPTGRPAGRPKKEYRMGRIIFSVEPAIIEWLHRMAREGKLSLSACVARLLREKYRSEDTRKEEEHGGK